MIQFRVSEKRMPRHQLLRGLDYPAGDALRKAMCKIMANPLPDSQGAARANVTLTLGHSRMAASPLTGHP